MNTFVPRSERSAKSSSVAGPEDDVGKLRALQRVALGLRAERPDSVRLVLHERHPEPSRQVAAVERRRRAERTHGRDTRPRA